MELIPLQRVLALVIFSQPSAKNEPTVHLSEGPAVSIDSELGEVRASLARIWLNRRHDTYRGRRCRHTLLRAKPPKDGDAEPRGYGDRLSESSCRPGRQLVHDSSRGHLAA